MKVPGKRFSNGSGRGKMNAEEARSELKARGISRYTYDRALDSASITGYYGIELANSEIIHVTFDDNGFHIWTMN
jgi:hypothetical protein